MIESPFTFFQMQVEGLLVNALETMQPDFGKAPECLDAVDVRPPPNELTLPMMHSEVLLVPNVHKAVVASPTVTVNDASHIHTAPNDGLQTGFLRVWNNLRVVLPVPLEHSKPNRLSARAASTLATDTSCADARFIPLHFTTACSQTFT